MGQTVFAGGLHTGINEHNEVRSMVLTPTKAHNQFMPALARVSESLATYGHEPIQLVYTDNVRGDKAELEKTLPELKADVIPVPDISTLVKLTVPPEYNVSTLSSTFQINTRLNSIMDCLKDGVDDLFTAVDMEWPVDRVNGIQGKIALVSIAVQQDIFLIPVSARIYHLLYAVILIVLYQLYSHWRNGFLPSSLLAFLRAPRVRKVGVGISGDLTRLFRDCKFATDDEAFAGAINLGQFAKSRNAAAKATIGLADLTAAVLRRHLPKDPAVRVSLDWDTADLSQEQVEYAARDVYASWAVFQALTEVSVGVAVTAGTPAGTAVSLYGPDQSLIVAQGHIALERPKQYLGVNITPTRVLVVITEVFNTGHIVPGELLGTKKSTPLSLFPDAPFHLVCKAKHLRTRSAATETHPTSTSPNRHAPTEHTDEMQASDRLAALSSSPSDTASEPVETFLQDEQQWHQDSDTVMPSDQLLSASQPDTLSASRAEAIHSQLVTQPLDGSSIIRSRVLGDIWHLMDQFYISVQHGLRRPFARALRDAFFIPDAEDKAILEAFLLSKDVTWDSMVLYHSHWLWQRVRRFVPAPDELLARVSKVIMTFGPLKDAVTGFPLFNEKAWETSENVLENIRRGYYSDPPNIQLYFSNGYDKYGLLRYRCCRGTNGIEGGIHQNIIRWFGAFNASPDFAVELLRDYILYHNLKVSTCITEYLIYVSHSNCLLGGHYQPYGCQICRLF